MSSHQRQAARICAHQITEVLRHECAGRRTTSRTQRAAASVSFSLRKRHASIVVNTQVAGGQWLTRCLKIARKWRKSGAKAFVRLLEGRFEGREAHLRVNHPRFEEVALEFIHKAEVHFLSRLTEQLVHKP